MCVTLARIKVVNRDNTWEGLRLLLSQITVTIVFIYVVAHSTYYINLINASGNPALYFLTLLFALVIYQLKSVDFLYAIYFVIVRRFMHLNINEQDYLKPEILAIPKQENALPRL